MGLKWKVEMPGATAELRFNGLNPDQKRDDQEYNFKHFRAKHLLSDARATFTGKGIKSGEMAPDFTAFMPGGGSMRLSDLRGKPVLLHFGSFT